MLMFSEKDPTEALTYAADFRAILGTSTITATSVAISVYQGTDASAASMLFGTSATSGGLVTQRIGYGVDGVTYRVEFRATTTTGDTPLGVIYLPVNTQ